MPFVKSDYFLSMSQYDDFQTKCVFRKHSFSVLRVA